MLGVHGAGAPIIAGSSAMRTRSNGAMAGFGWLKHGIGVCRRHPKPLLGGAALLLLACMLPSLVTLPMQFQALQPGTPPSPSTIVWLMVGSVLLGLLIVPLYAGYLQLIDAVERGRPARVLDIFEPYRQGDAWRLIGYGVALILAYVAMVGIVIVATGGGIARWYMQALTAGATHQPAPTTLPDGFGIAMALFVVLGLFMVGFYAVSLGQVALRRRSVLGAIGDGLVGALKNLLPLLVFAVSAVLAWMIVAIAFGVLALLLALLGKFIGAWLVLVLITPLYIALLLALFAVMFAVTYHVWRDVCGDDIESDTVPSIAA